MKHLIIILALFVGNTFAEDKFPIKLTCEFGDTSFLVNVGSIPRTTWVELHPSSKRELNAVFGPYQPNLGQLGDKRIYARKGNKFKQFIVTENRIEFKVKRNLDEIIFFINRLSGGITAYPGTHGQCFKGFKEYKERKF